MNVSPQHRMLFTGPRAEMLFGEHEVLIAAIHLVGQPGVDRITPLQVTYIHLLFDQHEIICADGAWTESFQPGRRTLGGMEAEQRDEILLLFPELARRNHQFSAARMTLRAHEVKVLLAA